MERTNAAATSTGDGQLATGLRHLVDEAEGLLRNAGNTGDQAVDALRLKFDHQLQRLRTQIDDLESTVAHRARRVAREADQTVHAHPYGAMGVAAAVGVLVGLLVGRRG